MQVFKLVAFQLGDEVDPRQAPGAVLGQVAPDGQ